MAFPFSDRLWFVQEKGKKGEAHKIMVGNETVLMLYLNSMVDTSFNLTFILVSLLLQLDITIRSGGI